MAEFHVHGSRAVVDAIQTSISKLEDCRLAEPGEFTKIAFQNGKIDLMKAEGISDLISSETEIQRQQAIKIMSGKSATKFNSLCLSGLFVFFSSILNKDKLVIKLSQTPGLKG